MFVQLYVCKPGLEFREFTYKQACWTSEAHLLVLMRVRAGWSRAAGEEERA